MNPAAWSAVPVALGAGLAAGLNPCCLPMYPAAVAACSSLATSGVRSNLGVAALFVLGSSLATASLGVVAGLAGRALQPLGGAPIYALAAVPLLAGLHTLGVVRLPVARVPTAAPAWLRSFGAAGAGAAMALVVTPCSTPVAATILAAAASTSSAPWGGALMFLYGLGLGVPVLVIGAAAASATDRVAGAWSILTPVTGVLQIAFGLWLVWLA